MFFLSHGHGRSEVAARRSGQVLAQWLSTKKGSGEGKYENLHIVAHSMGNIVASEAFRSVGGSALVDSYSAAEAAVAVGSYDSSINDMLHESLSKLDVSPETAWKVYNDSKTMPPDLYRWSNLSDLSIIGEQADLSSAEAREYWGAAARPYYDNLQTQVSGGKLRMVSYYNLHDAATTGWEVGQLTKPDASDPPWDYVSSSSCLTTAGYPHWPDNSVCDSTIPEGRFYHDSVEIPWPEEANEQDLFDIISRISPARTRALGRIQFNGSGMPPVNDGTADPRAMRDIRYGHRQNLMSTVDLSIGGTTSNFDHSMQYHGYLTENRARGGAFRRHFWTTLLAESLDLESEKFSGLAPN